MAKKINLTDDEQVKQWMDASVSPLKKELESIRSLVKKTDKRVSERIKWNAPSYHIAGEDFLTFGPERKGKLLLVFHHPFIVNISSPLLEGDYKDRRLVYFDSATALKENKKELERIVKSLVEQITKKVV